MHWCLDCHRNPAKCVRPEGPGLQHGLPAPADDPGLGERLVREYKIAGPEHLTSCSICHR